MNTGVPRRRQQYLLCYSVDQTRVVPRLLPVPDRCFLPAGSGPRGCPPVLLFTGRRAVLPVPTSPSVCRRHFLSSASCEAHPQRDAAAPLHPPAGEALRCTSSSLGHKCRLGRALPGGICLSHQSASSLPEVPEGNAPPGRASGRGSPSRGSISLGFTTLHRKG